MDKDTLLLSFVNTLNELETELQALFNDKSNAAYKTSNVELIQALLKNIQLKLNTLCYIYLKLSTEYSEVSFEDSSGNKVEAGSYLSQIFSLSLCKLLFNLAIVKAESSEAVIAIVQEFNKDKGINATYSRLLDILLNKDIWKK